MSVTLNLYSSREYTYSDSAPNESHVYLWPALLRVLGAQTQTGSRDVLEIGCGNGATAHMLAERGYDVTGIDPSVSGIAQANNVAHRSARFFVDKASAHYSAPVVIALEVIEHVPSTREFMQALAGSLASGGTGIISTPYHGWLKTLAIVMLGGFEQHFNPLWEGGHVKFFTPRNLRQAALDAGLRVVGMRYAGRFWPFSKSMLLVVTK